MNLMEGGIVISIGIILIIVVLAIIETTWNETKVIEAMVIEKQFSPEETSTGVAPVFTSNGTGVAITTSHKDDEYIVFVGTNEGALKAETTMEKFLKLKKDDRVNVEVYYGKLFGSQVGVWIP